MSEIKNVGYTWMALNTSNCNHLTPLRFRRLTVEQVGVGLKRVVNESLRCQDVNEDNDHNTLAVAGIKIVPECYNDSIASR